MSHTSFYATWPQSHASWERVKQPKLKLDLSFPHGITVLRCQGRISYREEASQFSRKVAELLPHSKQLILDLSKIDVIDSAGLGELALIFLWSQAGGCAIKIAAPRPNVLEMLQLTNLVSVLEIHPTLDEALQACRPI
jgi:anti-sigma B factor antagonist